MHYPLTLINAKGKFHGVSHKINNKNLASFWGVFPSIMYAFALALCCLHLLCFSSWRTLVRQDEIVRQD